MAERGIRKRVLRTMTRVLDKRGHRVVPSASDVEPEFSQLARDSSADTMLSVESLYALFSAARHVGEGGIDGAIVQCGTWRGGSARLLLETLLLKADTSRDVYLYDTFEGMPEPGPEDRHGATGSPAIETWNRAKKSDGHWLGASLETVTDLVLASGYPSEKVHLVQGLVEETIPKMAPESISLLHLDTDWYSSTRHELIHLYPRLSRGGILIIDDYGSWQGARKATDEFLTSISDDLFLVRIDWSCRLAVKP